MILNDAHILLTGASRGIGAAMASEFAAKGARVTLVARDETKLADLAGRIGGRALAVDLIDRAARATVVPRAEEAMGRPVDVLVNNAGIDVTGAAWETPAADLARLVELNLTSVMDLTGQAIPGMIERGRGHVVFLSSMASVGALPGMAAYSATKAAVSHFASGLENDLRGLPIRLTTVQPGFVEPTDMLDSIMAYEPALASRRRFARLGLLPDVDRDTLARGVVEAVERDRRLLVMPRRARSLAGLVNLPRTMTRRVLTGVPPRVNS